MNETNELDPQEESGASRRKLTIKRPSEHAELRERLQKVLATSGLGARRGLEERILKGEILVNGERPELGAQVKVGDRISVDGKVFVVKLQEGDYGRILIYNKPDGEVTTRHDPEGRRTVFERLPRIRGARWIAVGRLDINTQGLLVFTTNGDLAQKLMHPENEFSREYLCRIHGEVSESIVQQLQTGIQLDDGPANFVEIEAMNSAEGQNEWWRVVIKEGRNREVRRMWEAVGLQVSRLKRSIFGPFSLPKSLHRGEVAEMEQADVVSICSEMGIGQSPAQLIAVDENAVRTRRVREKVDGKRIELPAGRAESYWTGERGYGGGAAKPARAAEFSLTDSRDDPRRARKPGGAKRKKPSFARGQRPPVNGAPRTGAIGADANGAHVNQAGERKRFPKRGRGPRDPNAAPSQPRDANSQAGQGVNEAIGNTIHSRGRRGPMRGPLGTSETYVDSDSYGNSIAHHTSHAQQHAGRDKRGRQAPVKRSFVGPMDNPIPNYAHQPHFDGNDAIGNVVGATENTRQRPKGFRPRGQAGNGANLGNGANQAPRPPRTPGPPRGPRPPQGAQQAPSADGGATTNGDAPAKRNRRRRRRGGGGPRRPDGAPAAPTSAGISDSSSTS